ncbi:MAG: aa3-type cytochrome c oxidase subunit IV [Sphingobium sp.]|nr:aa3-type cytochrome c oxidase subunit IV [Sphingobium sp.]
MVHDEEIVAARSTFKGFVSLMTWGTIGSAIVGFLVILLISK